MIRAALSFLILTSCSMVPKGEVSSSANPGDEIARLASDLSVAQETNVDVLARKEYLKSYEYLEQAKKDLGDGKNQHKIIDDLRFGRQSLKRAQVIADGRKDKDPSLFESRQKAIKAGASRSTKLRDEWNGIDENLAAKADAIEKISPENLDGYQARYVAIEKKAVIESQLGKASSQVKGAESDGAEKSAPEALRQAEISLRNAESLIGSNVSNPSGFSPAVIHANNDAQYLSEVIETIRQNGKPMTESAAAKIVMQRRQIADLKNDLSTSEGNVAEAELKLDEKNRALSDKETDLNQKGKDLNAAQASIAIQSAIEKSRLQFSSAEAEAYQQGKNLLIRLKSMNFQSGRSELPDQSMGLLAKVLEVAKSLNAKQIKVEGHTDFMGTSDVNKKLSEQRASAVATYFKVNGFDKAQVQSEGYGFEKPIATNKSKAGRAQNRRVDVIITPEESPTLSR